MISFGNSARIASLCAGFHVWESHGNPYNKKDSVSCIQVTNIGGKWLVLVILQDSKSLCVFSYMGIRLKSL